jgi:hypothetical protein
VLLPLPDVAGARRMREDVRDAEVCVALVGDFVRETSGESARRQSEG